MGRDAFHAGVLDAEFLLEKSDLVVPAVDLGLEPDLMIPTEGRPGKQGCEGVVAQGQDLEDGRPEVALPAAGQGQFRCYRNLRENLLWEGSRRS